MTTGNSSRFVYLYVETKGQRDVPVYVGRGTADRVTDHGPTDDNPGLAAVIARAEYAVEVLECPDAASAALVEGALISAMRGRSTVALKNRRTDKHQFVPLGVPLDLAMRRALPALTPAEIAHHVGGRVLFVRIGPASLDDPARGVINPARPDASAVTDRLRRWWAISRWVTRWIEEPQEAPFAVVGVAGNDHRYVIGALDTSELDWSSVERDGTLVGIPVAASGETPLDAYELRGRSLSAFKIFGQGRHQHALVFDHSGEVHRPG